jgi:hypothetical protein
MPSLREKKFRKKVSNNPGAIAIAGDEPTALFFKLRNSQQGGEPRRPHPAAAGGHHPPTMDDVITHPHIFDWRLKCGTDDLDFRALAEARLPGLSPDGAALLSSLTDARRQAVAQLSDLGRVPDSKNAAVLEYVQLCLPLVGELQQGEQQQVGR